MYPTVQYVKQKFRKYNKEYFNGELPTPTFMLFHPRQTLGQFENAQRIDPSGDVRHTYTIRMSTFYDRTEHDVDETLIHEMIHFFIDVKSIKDSGSHGNQWTALAEEINKRGNWNISRETNVSNCPINPLYASKEGDSEDKVCVFAYRIRKSGIWFVFISSLSRRRFFESWLKRELSSSKFIDRYIVSTALRGNGFNQYGLCTEHCSGHEHTEQSLKEIIIPRLDDAETILAGF